jgi:hypothetical protein
MAMVSHERNLHAKYRGRLFVMLGVNCGDSLEKARATVSEKEMVWRHWWDGDQIRGPIETDYNVPHWPTTYVVDAPGIFRAIDLRDAELDQAIEGAVLDAEAMSSQR